jgi:hypothetical protein
MLLMDVQCLYIDIDCVCLDVVVVVLLLSQAFYYDPKKISVHFCLCRWLRARSLDRKGAALPTTINQFIFFEEEENNNIKIYIILYLYMKYKYE